VRFEDLLDLSDLLTLMDFADHLNLPETSQTSGRRFRGTYN
jgi:hypothetical protein